MRDVSESLAQGYAGNLPSLRELRRLCRMTRAEAASACLVSPETYRRWERDRKPNPTAVRLLAILAGFVPWEGWHGWEVHCGLLYPPGYRRHGLGPGHVFAIPFYQQRISALIEERAVLERERAPASDRDRSGTAS